MLIDGNDFEFLMYCPFANNSFLTKLGELFNKEIRKLETKKSSDKSSNIEENKKIFSMNDLLNKITLDLYKTLPQYSFSVYFGEYFKEDNALIIEIKENEPINKIDLWDEPNNKDFYPITTRINYTTINNTNLCYKAVFKVYSKFIPLTILESISNTISSSLSNF